MANTPRKMQDPTEAALSAIQDALNLRGHEPNPPTDLDQVGPAAVEPIGAAREGRRRSARATQTADEDLFFEEPAASPAQALEEQSQRRAANDDRQSVGQILHALQRRPSRGPYVIAGLFSLAWAAVGIVLTVTYFGTDARQVLGQGGMGLAFFGLLAAIAIPVGFFFVLAHMLARAQELRLIARSMTDAAMRLAEPETIARESIVTVGQAIRREVAAMGDGVERALARAAELEALVHTEVAALERAYNDNELRIRGLLEDLANQREAVMNQADQVRSAITGAPIGLTQDIAALSEMIAASVNDAAQRITRSLAEKGEHITLALGRAGDSMIDAIGDRGGDLLEQLNHTSDEVSHTLENATERLTSSVSVKTDHISEEFADLANRLSDLLSTRLDQVADGFSRRTEALTESLGSKGLEITNALVDTGGQLAETIAIRADEVNNTLKSTGESLVLDLTLRGSDVVAKLEETGSRITETIVTRSSDMVSKLEDTSSRITETIESRTANVTESFRQTADTLASTVNAKGDAVKEMLASRLQAFEDVFTHGGSQLAEKISQDSTSLGGLITRNLAEFDRTVKVYGGELVERLGQRSGELAEAMRSHVDNFDGRVGTKANEFQAALDQRIARVQEALDSRTQSLNDSLGSRILQIAKTLADGGKEVVSAVEKRINDVTGVINTRSAKLAETLETKTEEIDKTLGMRAMEIAGNLDSRISRFEELLVARVETATTQIEVRGQAAGNMIAARMEQLNQTIKTNAGDAERSLGQLATTTVEAIRAAAHDTERTLGAASSSVTGALKQQTEDVEHRLTAVSSGAGNLIKQTVDDAESRINTASSDLNGELQRNVGDVERRLAAVVTGVGGVLKQNAGEVERSLLGVSAEVVRSLSSQAEQMTKTINQRTAEINKALDDKSNSFLTAFGGRGQQFATDVDRLTAQAVSAIETKGLAFTKEMLKNSSEIAGIINDASSIASNSLTRTLQDLQDSARAAIEQSQRTASAAVSEVMDTHGMLRTDTTALFERLREANLLLQEVLSGATKNLGAIESSLSTRVMEFVSTMNDIGQRSASSSDKMEEHIRSFHSVTTNVLRDITVLAQQFDERGRALAAAAETIDGSNRRTEQMIGERRDTLDTLVTHLDHKADDLDQRFARFAGLLKDSFETAEARARDIARVIAESSSEGSRAIASQYELARTTSEEERRRTTEALSSIYDQATGQTHSMFQQASERFAEIVRDMKEMASSIQQELDSTRVEMRRGILELPRETAESAAQMRRVIIEQMDALAELNRIVARHGRGIDTADPGRRAARDEPVAANVGARSDTVRPLPRADKGGGRPAPSAPPRRIEAPPTASGQGDGRGGWLTDLLTRASREDEPPTQAEERTVRHTIESLDSLSVDIARMIDHDAAAELWDRYKRGERNVFTKRLYTLQGQKTFDEIGKRYRADREFKQTVDRYIAEFERLLEDVSRDDRGSVVARTYLTSETGKVYTMLAHAAGRFE